jgi:hypothetical protein
VKRRKNEKDLKSQLDDWDRKLAQPTEQMSADDALAMIRAAIDLSADATDPAAHNKNKAPKLAKNAKRRGSSIGVPIDVIFHKPASHRLSPSLNKIEKQQEAAPKTKRKNTNAFVSNGVVIEDNNPVGHQDESDAERFFNGDVTRWLQPEERQCDRDDEAELLAKALEYIEVIEGEPDPDDPFEWSGKGDPWDDEIWLALHRSTGSQTEKELYRLLFQIEKRIKELIGQTYKRWDDAHSHYAIRKKIDRAAKLIRLMLRVLKQVMDGHARVAPTIALSTNIDVGRKAKLASVRQFKPGTPEQFIEAMLFSLCRTFETLQQRLDRMRDRAEWEIESPPNCRQVLDYFASRATETADASERILCVRADILEKWSQICSAYWKVVIVRYPSLSGGRFDDSAAPRGSIDAHLH